jgi:glyoxylase-like metal-dependent hydrolase (beta-lactamase superfamily II)
LRLGRYELHAVRDGTFALDGGAMFGIVPRPLWEKRIAPDARNRIPLAARCLLAVDRAARRVILVDAGMGDKWGAKWIDVYGIDKSGGDLLAALRRLGFGPEDVTDLLLTHLHFDHAGGVTRLAADGEPELVFPRAVHHVQRRAWQWAHAPTEKDSGSFMEESYGLLQHSNLLHLVDGATELFPDVELIVSDGHTAAQQLPRFRDGATHLTFCGDVIPTAAHLKPSWVMAYDLNPLTTLEEKKVLVAEALEDDGVLFFEHDPAVAACRLEERDGATVLRAAVEI